MSVMQMLYNFKFLELMSSKRIDVFFYTLSVILFLFYFAIKIRKTPKVVEIVSRYSFGIYLLHPFCQKLTEKVLKLYMPEIIEFLYIIIVFFVGLGLSMGITNVFNQLRIGKYIVGKIGRGINDNSKITNNNNSLTV